jgi:hypothetical protein
MRYTHGHEVSLMMPLVSMPNDERLQSKGGIRERQLEMAGKDDGRHDDRS